MSMLYCRVLKSFSDGKLHNFIESLEEAKLENADKKGWYRGIMKNLVTSHLVMVVDRGGTNRSIRYKITDAGLELLKIAEDNQKVFQFLRHFKTKDKDNYWSEILKNDLKEGGCAADDLTPVKFIEVVDALCSKDLERARHFGNYNAYKDRIWKLINEDSVLDDIIMDPIVLDTIWQRIPKSQDYRERRMYFDFWNGLKSAIDWKKELNKSKTEEQSV